VQTTIAMPTLEASKPVASGRVKDGGHDDGNLEVMSV
jgi:hypothetical protein